MLKPKEKAERKSKWIGEWWKTSLNNSAILDKRNLISTCMLKNISLHALTSSLITLLEVSSASTFSWVLLKIYISNLTRFCRVKSSYQLGRRLHKKPLTIHHLLTAKTNRLIIRHRKSQNSPNEFSQTELLLIPRSKISSYYLALFLLSSCNLYTEANKIIRWTFFFTKVISLLLKHLQRRQGPSPPMWLAVV